MALRCNICSVELEEKDVENHIASSSHKENRERLAKAKDTGSDASVAKAWMGSL